MTEPENIELPYHTLPEQTQMFKFIEDE